jgi:hypothetical protein
MAVIAVLGLILWLMSISRCWDWIPPVCRHQGVGNGYFPWVSITVSGLDTSRVSTSRCPWADPIFSLDSFAHTPFELRAYGCWCYRCAACLLVTGALPWLGSGTTLCQSGELTRSLHLLAYISNIVKRTRAKLPLLIISKYRIGTFQSFILLFNCSSQGWSNNFKMLKATFLLSRRFLLSSAASAGQDVRQMATASELAQKKILAGPYGSRSGCRHRVHCWVS